MAMMEHRPPSCVGCTSGGGWLIFYVQGGDEGRKVRQSMQLLVVGSVGETESLSREVWRWQDMGQHVSQGFKPQCMLHYPIGLHLQNTKSKLQLLRISRQ